MHTNTYSHTQVSSDSTYLRAHHSPKTWVLHSLSRDLSHKPSTAAPTKQQPEVPAAQAPSSQQQQGAPANHTHRGLPLTAPPPPPPAGAPLGVCA